MDMNLLWQIYGYLPLIGINIIMFPVQVIFTLLDSSWSTGIVCPCNGLMPDAYWSGLIA